MNPEDQWLREEFRRAAEQVTPADRLSGIRARVAEPGASVSDLSARRSTRSMMVAVGAVAATVVAATVLAPRLFGGGYELPVATRGESTPAATPFRDPAIPVYYAASANVTQTLSSGRLTPLAREFHRDDNSDRMAAAIRELSSAPQDPDYRTWVPAGTVVDAREESGTIVVSLGSAESTRTPESMTDFQARTAGLQVVYTVRAVVGQGLLPVRVEVAGEPVQRLLGISVARLTGTRDAEALAPVNLTSPTEGDTVASDSLTLTGRGLDLGPGSTYAVTSVSTRERVRHGSIAVENPSRQGFQVFETRVDLSGLPAGDYLVSVTSRHGLAELLPDTKQFTIR